MQATLIEPKRAKINRGDGVLIPMLSHNATSVEDIEGFWVVAHCRSRHEKTMALAAADAGFGVFLPLEVRTVKRPGNGSYKLQVPFAELDGHLFLSSTCELEPGYPIPRDLHDFLEDQYSFFGIIEVRPSQQERFISQLGYLHQTAIIGRNRTKVAMGDKCRVVRGAYMGLEGKILKDGTKAFAKVVIDEIKYAAWVEISLDDLELI